MSENLEKKDAPKVEAEAPKVEETKVEAPVVEEVIEKEVPNLAYTENGAIGSGTNKGIKPKAAAPVKETSKPEKVGLFALNNVYSEEAGKITIGYNIVSKKASEWWLANRKDVRLATPAEIAEAFAE